MSLSKSRSEYLAKALHAKVGGNLKDLQKRILQIREVERDALLLVGGVEFRTRVPGDLFIYAGHLWTTELKRRALRKGEPASVGLGPKTVVVPTETPEEAERLRGILWE